MNDPTRAFTDVLPARIDRAEIVDPTLLLGGDGWSLSATCLWRWVQPDGVVHTSESVGVKDLVWDLVGEHIVTATWTGPSQLGTDPSFTLRSGGSLQLLSDGGFDAWVLHTPTLVLVGPLMGDIGPP